MAKSKMVIKFKNNHQKDFNVLFQIETDKGKFIIYSLDEQKEDAEICYAAKLVDDELVEIKKQNEKNLIIDIINNFNKGV